MTYGGELYVESSGDTVFDVLSPATNTGEIHFADPGASSGQIIYNHSGDTMSLVVASGVQAVFDGTTVLFDNGTSGVTSTHELQIESAGNTVIDVMSPAADSGRLYFTDPGADGAGRLIYSHVDNSLDFYTNATFAMSIESDGSVVVGAPTGGAKGAGTINATGVYDDNVLLSDYVFEPDYEYLDIKEMTVFYEKEKHLPTIDGRETWEQEGRPSLGKLVNQLWETIEVQALYISELEKRLTTIEQTSVSYQEDYRNNFEAIDRELNNMARRIAAVEPQTLPPLQEAAQLLQPMEAPNSLKVR